MSKTYETVIGLEVHVELATKTKIFCGCSTAFGGAPNSHTCPVCTGMPGSLPVLNKQVVEYAMAVGLATNCTITQYCKFDRKNYFYPDNPQNYQISQLYLPICRSGGVEIETAAGKKTIGIHEIHMEEDAGKLVHDEWEDVSIVDYNRSGVPLIEIVSEPDMRSADEVIAYLEKLRCTMQYLGVSDCKLQEGSMRADVNLSVRERGSEEFGTRTETKNLNSFAAIERAIKAETARQIDLIESGEKVVQETRRWNDDKEYSYAMRSKDTSMILTSWHNLSLYYGRFENIDSAVVYAYKVLQNISDENKIFSGYFYNIGDLYIGLGQYDSARYYLEKSLLFSPSLSMSYWSLAVMEAKLGNFKSAYHYLDTFVMVQDSLDASERLSEVQHIVYKNQTALEVKDEQIKSRKVIGRIVFSAIIICFVVALIYQRWINKKNNQQALYRQALQYADEKQNVMQQRIEENESALALLQDRENQNLDEIAQKEQLITQLKKEKLALRTWLFQQTSIYKKVMSLSDQQQVNKKIRKVMAAAELDKLKKTTFEIYADYISPLQAQYSQLTEDDLLVLCLQEAGISPLAISLCFGHTDTVALNQRKSRLKKKMSE